MKQLVMAMGKKHGLDFTKGGAHLVLSGRDTFMNLVIESPRTGMISVAHYYKQAGDSIADPDVEILIGCDGEFYPIAITHAPPFGYMLYAKEVDYGAGVVGRYKRRGQADLSVFVNNWATTLGKQGFREAEALVIESPEEDGD